MYLRKGITVISRKKKTNKIETSSSKLFFLFIYLYTSVEPHVT